MLHLAAAGKGIDALGVLINAAEQAPADASKYNLELSVMKLLWLVRTQQNRDRKKAGVEIVDDGFLGAIRSPHAT